MRVVLVIMLAAAPAWADGLELQTSLRPSFALVQRHGALNRGAGAGGRVSYSPLPRVDVLAIDLGVLCEWFDSIRHEDVEIERRPGAIVYDARRCALGPSISGRFGAEIIASGSVGLLYRYEARSDRAFVSPKNVLLTQLENVGVHQAVMSLRGAVEYRFFDIFSVGAEALMQQAVGQPIALDLSLAATMSVYMYP